MTKNKIPRKEDDNLLVKHARRELSLVGAFEKTEDYDGSIGKGTLALVKTFVKYGRDDMMKMNAMIKAFNELVRGELMSSPTDNPEEWVPMKGSDPTIWQNKRSTFFRSTDNGVTWFHMKDEKHEVHPSADHLTGEVPEDATIGHGIERASEENDGSSEAEEPAATESVQANTGSRADSGSAGETAAPTEGSGTTEGVPRRGLDDGVAAQSSEDTQGSEGSSPESSDRTAA